MRFDPLGRAGDTIIHGTLPNLYAILGIKPKTPIEDVRKAYRKLAREYHPDLNPDPKAHERMAVINEAFEVLSDPVRRSEYDHSIGNTVHFEPNGEAHVRKPESVSAQIVYRHRVHRTPVYSASFTKRKGTLVTTSFDNELIWWDRDVSGPERRIKLESGVVNVVQTVNEECLVAAGSTEQSLACWTVKDGVPRSWRHNPKSWVCTLAPSPDGESLAVGSVDNILRVLRIDKGSLKFCGISHKDSVTAVGWSMDSRTLASGSADATVKLWDGRTGEEQRTLDEIRSTVTSLAFSPSGRWIAAAAVDLSIRVFDLRNGKLVKKFFGHTKPVEALTFHPQSWLLASASRDGTVGLWNVDKGIGHGQIQASHQSLSCVAFDPRGRLLVAGGLDKILRVWAISVPD